MTPTLSQTGNFARLHEGVDPFRHYIFLGGLHGSGARQLHEVLLQHPQLAGMRGADGQSLQGQALHNVRLGDDYLGGAGAFALHPRVRRLASRPLSVVERDDMLSAWDQRWTDDVAADTRWVEFSPSNLLRPRVLADAFPGCRQLVVVRHPVADAYATREELCEPDFPLCDLIEHWLSAHESYQRDHQGLRNIVTVHAETLADDPQSVLDGIVDDWGLAPHVFDTRPLRELHGNHYVDNLHNESDRVLDSLIELEDHLPPLGYTLEEPRPVGPILDVIPKPRHPPSIPPPLAASAKMPQSLIVPTFGTRGDIEPCVALAKAFSEAGYRITLLSTDDHRAFVESRGVDFVSLGRGSRFEFPLCLGQRPEQQADAFFAAMRLFYERYGTTIVGLLQDVIEARSIDCALVGSCVFFRALLREHFGLPLVNLNFSPLYIDPEADHDELSIVRYAQSVVRHAYAASNFKIHHILDEAYAACGINFRHADEKLHESMVGMKETLTLRGFSQLVQGNAVPGFSEYTTGYWRLSPLRNEGQAPELDAALLTWLESGPPPLCLNFGSMEIWRDDVCPWSEELIAAIQRSGHRCLAIGDSVPDSVRTWAYWVPAAPHSLVFPHCAAVIHHGGAGTTAACLAAATPAIIVPVLTWADQPIWATWVQAEGAGVHIVDPQLGFDDAIRTIVQPEYREQARRVADRLREDDGMATALAVFEGHFAARSESRAIDRETFRFINDLPVSDARKTWLSAGVLVRNGENGMAAVENRAQLFESIGKAAKRWPVFKSDWPRKDQPLDLAVEDLPHESSLQEWWYLHTHLQSPDGRSFSVFSALFERLFGEERLAYAHSSVVDVESDRHYTYAVGDPRIPGVVAPLLRRRPSDDYFKHALAEMYERGASPSPDRIARENFVIPRNVMDFRGEALHIHKIADGEYEVEQEKRNGFGFRLRYRATKIPILNGRHGVVFGPSADDNMFYYSFTRMDVSGELYLDSETLSVSGSGWYDHEFGGDTAKRNTSHGLGTYSWSWMGLQLDDGTELCYATLVDEEHDEALHDHEVLFIDADGVRTYHKATIEPLDTWSSMRSYIEYEVAWRMRIADLDIDLTIEAAKREQELQSVIADPAYWEGRVNILGRKAGALVGGLGFCEQFGRGGDRSNYKRFLSDVSREVRASVELNAPFDMSQERMRDLIADREFEGLVEGVDRDTFVDTMVRPVRELIDRGGKGWRSMSFMLCADAVGGDPSKLRNFLAFPEFIHTGSLIIDDIQDQSQTRRGGPACHLIYGTPTAINAGTAAYFMGERLLHGADLSDSDWLRIYKLYFTCMRASHTGQGMDIHGLRHLVPDSLERGDTTTLWSQLMAVHRLKSGVAAMTAARIGVILGGGSPQQEQALGDYFLALGTAFQIVDDVINIRGFESELKDVAEDLREGKITAPVVRAFSALPPAQAQALWEALQGEPDVATSVHLIESCGAIEWCHQAAHDMIDGAWDGVDALILDSHAKLALRTFGRFVVDVRDY
ncbi:MAG: polyprenyl synthetase family protein [Polyangiaceae bacterium]